MGSGPSGSAEKADLQLTKQPAAASFRRASRRKRADDQKQAAVPRRRCRQPFAHRTVEGSAREARARRDQRGPSSRRSRTARSRRSSESRRRPGSGSRPTGSSAAHGGISISSACSKASRCTTLDHGIQFHGVQTKAQSIRIKGKLGFSNHPMLDHFRFLKAHARAVPKMTHSEPGGAAFPPRAERRRHQGVCRPRRHLRRPG